MSRFNALVAWPYLQGPMLDALRQIDPRDFRFLLDSGAFTAWKAGTTLKLADYLRFIDALPVRPWRHFMLDVVGDPAATRRNYEESLKLGYNPVPIFTRGEDPGLLDFYFATSDLVAIGGLVGTRGSKGFVNGIMRHVGQRHVHWLGFMTREFLGHYRPYSVDSSSMSRGVRFGEIELYMGRGRWLRVPRATFKKAPPAEVRAALARCDVAPGRLATDGEWVNTSKGRAAVEQVCFRSWALFQHDVEERLGTKVFLAGTTGPDVLRPWHGRLFWRERGVIPPAAGQVAEAA